MRSLKDEAGEVSSDGAGTRVVGFDTSVRGVDVKGGGRPDEEARARRCLEGGGTLLNDDILPMSVSEAQTATWDHLTLLQCYSENHQSWPACKPLDDLSTT